MGRRLYTVVRSFVRGEAIGLGQDGAEELRPKKALSAAGQSNLERGLAVCVWLAKRGVSLALEQAHPAAGELKQMAKVMVEESLAIVKMASTVRAALKGTKATVKEKLRLRQGWATDFAAAVQQCAAWLNAAHTVVERVADQCDAAEGAGDVDLGLLRRAVTLAVGLGVGLPPQRAGTASRLVLSTECDVTNFDEDTHGRVWLFLSSALVDVRGPTGQAAADEALRERRTLPSGTKGGVTPKLLVEGPAARVVRFLLRHLKEYSALWSAGGGDAAAASAASRASVDDGDDDDGDDADDDDDAQRRRTADDARSPCRRRRRRRRHGDDAR